MNEERRAFVETIMDIASDFSDGAFWGFMQENDIDLDEVIAVSEMIQAEKTESEGEK